MQRSITEQVRELRNKHGLNQSQLAAIAGVSLPSLSRFENGKETIRLDILTKILDSLGYHLSIEANNPFPSLPKEEDFSK